MKYINDFEVKTIEEACNIEITNISLKDKEDIYDGVYINYEYKDVPLHIWLEMYPTKEERIKEAIKQIQEESRAYEEVSQIAYQKDFFYYIADSIKQKYKLKNADPLVVKVIEDLGAYSFRMYLKKYIEQYTQDNKQATNGDVYMHCMKELNEENLKKITYNKIGYQLDIEALSNEVKKEQCEKNSRV